MRGLTLQLPDHLAQRITRAPLEKQFMRDLSGLLRIGQLSKPPLGIPSESPEDGTNGFGMQKGVGVRRDHVNKKKPGVKAAGKGNGMRQRSGWRPGEICGKKDVLGLEGS